jgi:hypothetical protein
MDLREIGLEDVDWINMSRNSELRWASIFKYYTSAQHFTYNQYTECPKKMCTHYNAEY